MSKLADAVWPPDPISTDRLLIRCTRESDRAGYVELLCSVEANRHLGGAADRDEVEAAMPAVPGNRPGVFAVESDGRFIGTVTLEHHPAGQRGPVEFSGNELEISYVFDPATWGQGYATEAVDAVITWADVHLPDVPLVLVTQVANEASLRLARRLGFDEVARFVEHDAEQWCGVRT